MSERDANATALAVCVPDMDCAACAARIRSRLEALPGVESVTARVVRRELKIEYDATTTSADRILAAVRNLGFDVEAEGKRTGGEDAHFSPWRTGEARLVYASGGLLGLGLLAQVLAGTGTTAAPGSALGNALLTGAALVGGSRFFPKALRAARRLALDMHFLMTAAIAGALVIGHFAEAASIAFLFGVAELLEDHAVARARRSIEALVALAPRTARVVRDGAEQEVAVEDVRVGERVRVRPGERIPVDGAVEEGSSLVDQSPITGEPMPVEKSVGSEVYAGSFNQAGYLEVRASKPASDTTFAHIIHLVEEAQGSRAPTQRFVERFARIYTPVVTAAAVLVMLVPPLFFSAGFETWFVRGLTLLVISCPCALVISTPVTVVSGITSAARNGVLIKGGTYLEAAASVRAVAFDKTGTLTERRAEVTDVIAAPDGHEADLLRLAAALESRSEHPIAEAIRRRAQSAGVDPDGPAIDAFEALPGLGARARVDGQVYQVGRPELFTGSPRWSAILDRLAGEGKTVVCVGTERDVLGVIAVHDPARPAARHAVAGLRRQGVKRTVMLTGDRRAAAQALARELDLDEVHGELLPAQKVEMVRRLQRESGAVAMVGDGVNDAPALAAATVGIAMGAAGSDAALETAHVALMSDDLTKLPYLFRLSKLARRVIRQNVTASILLKMSLALGVFPGWVSLVTAVLVGDMGASIAVTANALRVARLGTMGNGTHTMRDGRHTSLR